MKKEERRQRLALTLLASLFVFIIIAVAAVLSVLIAYFLIRLGIVKTVNSHPNSGTLFLLIPLISTILGFLITFLTGKFSLKPVIRLIHRLNQLAEGDFKTRIEFGKPISKLALFKEIENSFNTAAEEPEHTEMLRSDFINNFSHEFKTPIVSIAGFAKLLRCGNLTKEQTEEYLAVSTGSFINFTRRTNPTPPRETGSVSPL